VILTATLKSTTAANMTRLWRPWNFANGSLVPTNIGRKNKSGTYPTAAKSTASELGCSELVESPSSVGVSVNARLYRCGDPSQAVGRPLSPDIESHEDTE
jgi:hypothetical protein